MDNETLDALKGSIEHKWAPIVETTTALDNGRMNCNLCTVFLEKDCNGCPVKETTGHEGCDFTPYMEWRAHQQAHIRGEDYVDTNFHRREGCEECLRLATNELIFLKSLLPKTT